MASPWPLGPVTSVRAGAPSQQGGGVPPAAGRSARSRAQLRSWLRGHDECRPRLIGLSRNWLLRSQHSTAKHVDTLPDHWPSLTWQSQVCRLCVLCRRPKGRRRRRQASPDEPCRPAALPASSLPRLTRRRALVCGNLDGWLPRHAGGPKWRECGAQRSPARLAARRIHLPTLLRRPTSVPNFAIGFVLSPEGLGKCRKQGLAAGRWPQGAAADGQGPPAGKSPARLPLAVSHNEGPSSLVIRVPGAAGSDKPTLPHLIRGPLEGPGRASSK